MNNNLHILVLPSWYPTTSIPLNGIFFKEQTQALNNAGIKVGVVYPEIRGLSYFNFNDLIRNHFHVTIENEDGIETIRKHSWNLFPKSTKLQAKQWIYEASKLFSKYIMLYGKPDIIHAHSALWAGYTAMLLSKKFNIPYIITEHSSSYAFGLIKEWQKPYIQQSFKSAVQVISVSTAFADILSKYSTGSNISIIPNMIDTDYFYPKPKEKTNKFTFLYVGFLKKQKGVETLIRAFARAFENSNNVLLRIGGDGEQREELESLVDKLNISDKVEFLGMLSRSEVRKQLWDSNAFVFPSFFETFGIVLIEALATGTPVISTKSGGPQDIVVQDVGILVEPNNIDRLAEAIKNMYISYNCYDSDTIRKYAVKCFSNNTVINQLIELYRKHVDL